MEKVARNDPCPCGSGKKYKRCCMGKPPVEVRRKRLLLPLFMLPIGIGLGIWIGYRSGLGVGLAIAGATVVMMGIIMSVYNPPASRASKSDSAAIDFGSKK